MTAHTLTEPVSTSTGEAPAVRLIQVSKSFSRGDQVTRVLHEVDLTINQGECAFLLGPSGSGKTTLMSIIGCLLTPDEGEAHVLGRSLREMSKLDSALLRRRNIGFVFQKFHLIRGLSALENVATPLRLDGLSAREAQERARPLLERVGLAEKANESPGRLSVGQCQRVAIARALAADPDIVLADEPSASLDAESGQRAMQLLRELTVVAGKTLVVVTHDQRILPAEPCGDRIFSMDSGSLRESPSAPSETKP